MRIYLLAAEKADRKRAEMKGGLFCNGKRHRRLIGIKKPGAEATRFIV
jgi:hypothetical protein